MPAGLFHTIVEIDTSTEVTLAGILKSPGTGLRFTGSN